MQINKINSNWNGMLQSTIENKGRRKFNEAIYENMYHKSWDGENILST